VTYRFTIERLPSAALSRPDKIHWSKRNRLMQMDKDDIRAYFLHVYERPPEPFKKAKVTVTSYVRYKRTRDADRWHNRFVGFMDGLSGLVYEDDSMECIGEPNYPIVVDKDKAGPWGLVEFQITEA